MHYWYQKQLRCQDLNTKVKRNSMILALFKKGSRNTIDSPSNKNEWCRKMKKKMHYYWFQNK